jgi:hypothetical protein
MEAELTQMQNAMKQRHGTPTEYANACMMAVPGFISFDEAQIDISKYQSEWDAAGKIALDRVAESE